VDHRHTQQNPFREVPGVFVRGAPLPSQCGICVRRPHLTASIGLRWKTPPPGQYLWTRLGSSTVARGIPSIDHPGGREGFKQR
jgi:hypothetical protein